jgi:8-oxo-dGTP diphosphatase
MTDKLIQQKVVLGGVVVRDGKVLILQRSENETVLPGLWELPSGKKEPLEETEVALIREVEEETGLKVAVKALVSVFDYQIEKPDVIRDSTQINFLVEVVDGNYDVKTSDEHQATAWVSKEDMNDYGISDPVKKVIMETFDLMTKLGI